MQIIVCMSKMGSGEEKSTRSLDIARHDSITSVSLLLRRVVREQYVTESLFKRV